MDHIHLFKEFKESFLSEIVLGVFIIIKGIITKVSALCPAQLNNTERNTGK